MAIAALSVLPVWTAFLPDPTFNCHQRRGVTTATLMGDNREKGLRKEAPAVSSLVVLFGSPLTCQKPVELRPTEPGSKGFYARAKLL